MSIKLCVHPPRGGFTVRKSWGTKRFTRPSYYVCTHHKEISPWENLVGPRDFLVIKWLFSRSVLVDYVNQTMYASTTRKSWGTTRSRSSIVNYVNQIMCASTTRRFHREKILRDHKIYSSIILCVHPPQGGLTVRKSCGTMRFSRDQMGIF